MITKRTDSLRIGIGLALVLASASVACSGGSLGPRNPGAGGSVSNAGAAGFGGNGTGGGGGANYLRLPSCIASAVAACAPAGTCSTSSNDAGDASSVCFASGVHVAVTKVASSLDCGGFVTVASFTKPDGSPCFSFESYVDVGMACEGIRYTWKDAGGVVLATGVRNPYNFPALTISCAGFAETIGCGDGNGPSTGVPPSTCCNVTGLGLPTCGYPSCSPGSCPN